MHIKFEAYDSKQIAKLKKIVLELIRKKCIFTCLSDFQRNISWKDKLPTYNWNTRLNAKMHKDIKIQKIFYVFSHFIKYLFYLYLQIIVENRIFKIAIEKYSGRIFIKNMQPFSSNGKTIFSFIFILFLFKQINDLKFYALCKVHFFTYSSSLLCQQRKYRKE